MVPHQGGRVKRDSPALLEHPPADIDIVAGRAELRVKAADGVEDTRADKPCCSRVCAPPRGRSIAHEWARPASFATASAIGPSPGGGIFGPPTAA